MLVRGAIGRGWGLGLGVRMEAGPYGVPAGAYGRLPLPHDDLVRLKTDLQRLVDGLS